MGLLDDPNVVMGLLGASAGLLTPTIGGQFGAGVANGLRGGMQGFMGNRQYELEAARNAAELENLKAHAEYYRRQADPRLSEKYGLTPLIDETGGAWQLTDRGGLKKVDLPGRKFQPLINQDLGGYRTANDPYTAAPIRRFDKTQTPDGIMREGQILEPAGAPAGDGTLPPLPNPAPGAPLPNLPPPGGASFNFANPEDARAAVRDYAGLPPEPSAMPGYGKDGRPLGRVARPVPGFVENKAAVVAAEEAAKLPAERDRAVIQVEKAYMETLRKAEAERINELGKKAASAGNFTAMIPPDIDQIIDKATGSGAGAVRDKFGRMVGYSTDGAVAGAKLEALAGWLTANVPRFEGPQSDADRAYYLKMAGALGDPGIPSAEKKSALKEVMRIMEIQGKAKPSAAPKGGYADLPTPDAGPIQVKSVDEAKALPPGTVFLDPNGVRRVR